MKIPASIMLVIVLGSPTTSATILGTLTKRCSSFTRRFTKSTHSFPRETKLGFFFSSTIKSKPLWHSDKRCFSGKKHKTLEDCKKELEFRRQALGERHLDVAASHIDLGNAYWREMGDHDTAIELHKEALDIRLETIGDRHQSVAAVYNNLAHLYASKREYDTSVKYYEKALTISLDVLGENHIYVANVYNGLATVYAEMSEYEKAVLYFEKALDILQDQDEEDHPLAVAIHFNLKKIPRQ